MRTFLECVPCFLRQALESSRLSSDDPAVHEAVLRETLRLAMDFSFDDPPPLMGQRIHRAIRKYTGDPDPYGEAKRRSTELALGLYPRLKRIVETSRDPFAVAVRLATAGNIIDLGVRSVIDDGDIEEAIEHALDAPIDEEAIALLRKAVNESEDILYLADNAGEIVLDRLLIEQLPAARITLVVKGSPVINDATREDAEAAGLADLVSIRDNGSDAPGTILDDCSQDFRNRFEQCDLVIAKGQGNYETLSGAAQRMFFLLKVKCPVIARDVGCELGLLVVREVNGRPRPPGGLFTPAASEDAR